MDSFRRGESVTLLVICLVLLTVSGIHPTDRLTWFLEVLPILVAIPILILTARRFPLTALNYRLLFFHSLVLILGAHYTYAKVPPGLWIQELLGLARNHYDRFGHFVQGFVPAILTREILLRCTPLVRGGWLFFLVLCVCLAISASYEFLEWWAAVIAGGEADDFLAMQGDPWDAQWDMFLALVGAATAQLVLWRVHDRELKAIQQE